MLPASRAGAQEGNKDGTGPGIGQQALSADDLEDATQVVGHQHQAHVGRGPFHPFFGEHVAVTPLSLDGPEGMLDNGLPPLVKFRLRFDVLPVSLKDRGVSVALDELAILCSGAQVPHRERLAGPGAWCRRCRWWSARALRGRCRYSLPGHR